MPNFLCTTFRHFKISHAPPPPVRGFLNPPYLPPAQRVGNQPTYLQVEVTLLKRRPRTFTHRQYRSTYSFIWGDGRPIYNYPRSPLAKMTCMLPNAMPWRKPLLRPW